MNFSISSRSLIAALLAVSLLAGAMFQSASAQARDRGQSGQGAGAGQPPKTKKQCLKILKQQRNDLAKFRKSHPALKQAALKKVAAQRAKFDALKAAQAAIQPQIDAIMATNTEGFTQADIDAMNAQIDALIAQQSSMQDSVDEAEGNVDEATMAYDALVQKYKTDVKYWPINIKHIKAYCAKM